MPIPKNTSSYQDIRLEGNLIPYLKLTGWKQLEEFNTHWFVFLGGEDSEGAPLEIVLPKNPRAHDLGIYFENAVNLLSGLANEPLQDTVRRIIFYDCDVLYSRNLETGEYNSITLRMAAQQVGELKQLVNYAACSEHQPKPYFLQSQFGIAKEMVEHYRFGHTFTGSFGFTILSKIIRLPVNYQQLSLFPNEPPPVLATPIERRVMERIVRGFSITKIATEKYDSHLLVEEYASGFNSNMCQAVVKMSQCKRMPMEYSIFWSPKYKPADDVDAINPIQLSEMSYDYLEYAANELKQLKPEYVTVKGRIIGLSSKDNPLGTSANRSVVIRGKFKDLGRPVDILVELEKDDYLLANQAHLGWNFVEVSGIISRSGYGWRLSEPSGFNIT